MYQKSDNLLIEVTACCQTLWRKQTNNGSIVKGWLVARTIKPEEKSWIKIFPLLWLQTIVLIRFYPLSKCAYEHTLSYFLPDSQWSLCLILLSHFSQRCSAAHGSSCVLLFCFVHFKHGSLWEIGLFLFLSDALWGTSQLLDVVWLILTPDVLNGAEDATMNEFLRALSQ